MAFRVLARTLLHLGAELISSDEIALGELVKNSFDAGARVVDVDIVYLVPYKLHSELCTMLRAAAAQATDTPALLRQWRQRLLPTIHQQVQAGADLSACLERADTLKELAWHYSRANTIVIRDFGDGMSLHTLNDVYLTIGTRSRLEYRTTPSRSDRTYFGEKGVGRLSVMRLGDGLTVTTSESGDTHWNTLEVDWGALSHDSDEELHEFKAEPRRGEPKSETADQGTTICITRLHADWNPQKVEDLAEAQFSKQSDPFEVKRRYPVRVKYNGATVAIPPIDKDLLSLAHATVRAALDVRETGPEWTVRLTYGNKSAEHVFDGEHLSSIVGTSTAELEHLGPFTAEAYWYNRQKLRGIDSIGDRNKVLERVRHWGGGLMLFRDGFRVAPYADVDDDWLDLDRTALGSPGYKVNRMQIIGRVVISSAANPLLRDQTNREGLIDNGAKAAFIELLRDALISRLRVFLDDMAEPRAKRREPAALDEIGERVATLEDQVDEDLRSLQARVGRSNDPEITTRLRGIRASVQQMREVLSEAKDLAASYEAGRSDLIHLAGLGLMVEVLAHELHRALAHSIDALIAAQRHGVPEPLRPTLRSLELQLQTLRRRLSVLDPLSVSGRQRKEKFDVTRLVGEILKSHESQFSRHNIQVVFDGPDADTAPVLPVRAVKGMVVQVLENLISNSIYWLGRRAETQSSFQARIHVEIDPRDRTVRFSDNGPGIDLRRRDDVFRAFYTTKPPGLGKGLGLFIAREIAHYHGATLELEEDESSQRRTLHTFALTFPEVTP